MKVDYVDHMGSDLRVVDAARVSFNKSSEWDYDPTKGFLLTDRDAGLVSYLAGHNHFTPFTHTAITLREHVPIFVARQRFKHTVGFTYNEVSRRYVDDKPEFFWPDVWRKRAENKKQGSSDEEVVKIPFSFVNGDWGNYEIDELYSQFIDFAERLYEAMIYGGVAPEQARMVLPQSMYTTYYVTGSLSAFARAYRLRTDLHAQLEIQDLAKEWDTIIRPLFPVAWSKLVD